MGKVWEKSFAVFYHFDCKLCTIQHYIATHVCLLLILIILEIYECTIVLFQLIQALIIYLLKKRPSSNYHMTSSEN